LKGISVEKFTTISAVATPLPMNDIDTDMVIPAQYMTSVSREGYGENLFRRLRDANPNFPLNLPQYKGAQILIAGINFGCGSSREHAVWALASAGFKVVIAKSFADIFRSNAAKNGLLLIELKDSEVDSLLEQAKSGLTLAVDLEKQLVVNNNQEYHFEYDPFRKHCLLNGLEDIDYILSHKDKIATYRTNLEDRFFSDTTKVL
jgi:3-isopropylmalate/(R)-2-methylmalate dehydratase small subunit